MDNRRPKGHTRSSVGVPVSPKKGHSKVVAKRQKSAVGRVPWIGSRIPARSFKWALWVGFAICLLIYVLRLDRVAGEFIDDAWYILLAKALAAGYGFTLTNFPASQVVHYYPHPAFVALLSLVFYAAPQFPANVLLMKAVSIVAIMLAGGFTYRYFVTVKETTPRLAAGLTLATLLTPGIVFLATSTVMSECFFILLQMAGIYFVERCVRTNTEKNHWLYLCAASALAAVAYLTRPIAMGLIVAAIIYFLIRKQFLKAIYFSVIVSLIVIPWHIYSRYYAPGGGPISDAKYLAQVHTSEFFTQAAGSNEQPLIILNSLLRQVITNAEELGGKDIGGILFSPLYRTSSASGMETMGMGRGMGRSALAIVVSLILSGLCIWGLILTIRQSFGVAELTVLLSLPALLVVPFWPFRYLLPLTPFLIFFTLEGIAALARLSRRSAPRSDSGHGPRAGAVAALFLLLIIGSSLYDHAAYLLCKFHLIEARAGWIVRFDESTRLMQWLSSNVDPATVVATENAPLVNLYTGLKTIPALDPVSDQEELRRKGAKIFVHVTPYFASSIRLDDPKYHVLYYTKPSYLYVLSLDQ